MRKEPSLRLLLKYQVAVIAAAILLASLFIRLYGLDGQALHCEELFTIPAATGQHYVYLKSGEALTLDNFPTSRQEFTTRVTPRPENGLKEVTEVLRRNVHLPLYFYFMHYWIKSAGVSEWSLRLPSVIFGALAALMMFLLGRELHGLFVGVVSSLLVALMPEHIFYSQEARMYSLLVLVAISSTYILALARARPSSTRLYILYAALSVMGLYTHYVYVFCFAFQSLFILTEASGWRWNNLPRPWLITQGCIALAFVPWLIVALSQRKASPEMLAWARANPSPESVLSSMAFSVTKLISVPELSFGWLSVGAAYALLTLGVISLRTERTLLWLLGGWVFVPLAGITLLDIVFGTKAIGVVRYWMVISPALYLLMAAGLRKLLGTQALKHRPLQAGVMAAVVLFLSLIAVWTARGELRPKPDRYKDLARLIDNYTISQGTEAVFTEGSNAIALALGYYSRREMKVLRAAYVMEKLKEQNLSAIFGNSDIWLVVSGESGAKVFLEKNGYRLVNQPVQFGHIMLYGYAAPRNNPSQSRPHS